MNEQAREKLRQINPGAYRQMLQIEETASNVWGCDGKEAAKNYLAVMLSPERETGLPMPRRTGRNKALHAVEAHFLETEAMYNLAELLEKTSLKRKTLTGVLCRLRERDLVRYAEGSTRLNPIFCHPGHPLALRKKEKR